MPVFHTLSQHEITGSCAIEIYTLLHGNPFALQDLPRWQRTHQLGNADEKTAFSYFWAKRQEFRSVIRYRVRSCQDALLTRNFDTLCLGKHWFFVNNLYISCKDIGPGLYIEHGFSTVIWARKIGANFRVNQNVTVGSNKGGCPTLGDNVSIYTHAAVLGPIHLGNNVRVGAGAVVIESIPANATVVPPKSRVILRKRPDAGRA